MDWFSEKVSFLYAFVIQSISNSMAIPINIEDLLNKRKIESNRIGFKKGWNPDRIYRTICAFANDFDNIGGGYIVVGIEEEERTGIAKRPVTGLPIEGLNDIQKDMVGYNSKIEHLSGVGTGLSSDSGQSSCK